MLALVPKNLNYFCMIEIWCVRDFFPAQVCCFVAKSYLTYMRISLHSHAGGIGEL